MRRISALNFFWTVSVLMLEKKSEGSPPLLLFLILLHRADKLPKHLSLALYSFKASPDPKRGRSESVTAPGITRGRAIFIQYVETVPGWSKRAEEAVRSPRLRTDGTPAFLFFLVSAAGAKSRRNKPNRRLIEDKIKGLIGDWIPVKPRRMMGDTGVTQASGDLD